MIAVKPDNDAGRVLAALVAAPGELDAEAIGVMLWPAPPVSVPPLKFDPSAAGAAYRAWLESVAGKRQTLDLWRSQKAEKASRLLARLQEVGLVEKMRPPALSAWWLAMVEEGGFLAAWERVQTAELDDLPGEDEEDLGGGVEAVSDRLDDLLTILDRVGKGPRNTRDVLGDRPSGTEKRAFMRLVDLGILVPSSYRWPTEAGRALVASWARQSREAA